ncbi:hypothetical protein [Azospirillum doebereinerae]
MRQISHTTSYEGKRLRNVAESAKEVLKDPFQIQRRVRRGFADSVLDSLGFRCFRLSVPVPSRSKSRMLLIQRGGSDSRNACLLNGLTRFCYQFSVESRVGDGSRECIPRFKFSEEKGRIRASPAPPKAESEARCCDFSVIVDKNGGKRGVPGWRRRNPHATGLYRRIL